MLLITVEALVAVSKDGKVTANPMARTHTDVGVWAFVAVAPAVVGKMDAQRSTLRCRVVRELASVDVIGAVALQKVPADGDFGCVVLVHASKTTTASTCEYNQVVNGYHNF